MNKKSTAKSRPRVFVAGVLGILILCSWLGGEQKNLTDTVRPALKSGVKAVISEGVREPIEDEYNRDIVFYSKKNDNMAIALTFDDGPHPHYTPLILEILSEYGVKATFFMIGENVKYYPSAAEAVLHAGHEIGNHTNHHKGMKSMSDREILQEIEACEDEIYALSEYKPRFIRPPEGAMSQQVLDVVSRLDYRIILWDVDTHDWAHTPPKEITRYVLETVQAGDIILMHDFIGHNSPTPEALRLMIPRLLEKGYKFVTVGELLDR